MNLPRETPPALLCPGLGSSTQEAPGPVRGCPEVGHGDGQRNGGPFLEDMVRDLGLFSCKKN